MRPDLRDVFGTWDYFPNALGYLRVMFAVDDIDETLNRLGKHAQLVGEVVQYEDAYRLCYVRAGGLLIGLAQELV